MIQHNRVSDEALDALATGDVARFRVLTGVSYSIHGLVVHGNHLGRTLGFPTANLELPAGTQFLAAHGVYAVNVTAGGIRYNGMTNAGLRPTINGKTLTIEVNLFGFSGDLYGKTIRVQFIHRIREERKFANLDELVNQIKHDRETALQLLS
jgi:riboflavin kinase/FMN adenylyltransferase